MRLVRIAIIVASCGGLFGGTVATAVAGTFCDSPQAKSKMWAPLCTQKASTVATPKVAATNNNGCTPLIKSPGAGASNPAPCCCVTGSNNKNIASCAEYPNLPVCTSLD
jgi:hypothetical protein